jgi:hypothetical protein
MTQVASVVTAGRIRVCICLTAAVSYTQAPRKVMLDTAAYLESKRLFEEAVNLYHKGGNSSRALELCFSAKLFDSLRAIADDLG